MQEGLLFRRHNTSYAILSMVLDAALTLSALALSVYLWPWLLQLMPSARLSSGLHLHPFFFVAVPLLWIVIFILAAVYDRSRNGKATEEIKAVTVATGLASLIPAGLLFFGFREVSGPLIAAFLVLDLSMLLGWRAIARIGLKELRLPATERRILIVGAGDLGRHLGEVIQERHGSGSSLTGYLDDDPRSSDHGLPVLGRLDDARQIVRQKRVDDVVIALPYRDQWQFNKLLTSLHDLPVQVRVMPDCVGRPPNRSATNEPGSSELPPLLDSALTGRQRLVKRLFDLIASSLSMLAVLPLMGLISVIIKLDSPGSAVFRQKRVGENGRLFDMYKFRTMIDGAEEMQEAINELNGDGDVVHKKPNDPRVTRVGRLLRRTSLDEVPQLINVLRGEMSLVGPRPEMPWLVNEYEQWQHRRFTVPQGITGWWQVNGRSDRPMHLHTEDDLHYIQNYSLWMDIFILLKTPLVVMRGKGAY